MNSLQFQDHLKFLMDKLLEAYIKVDFDEFERLKKKINSLKSVMNSYDIVANNPDIYVEL